MSDRFLLGILAVLAVLSPTTSFAQASEELPEKPKILGNAYDKTSGEYLYSEYHYCAPLTQQCSVHYRDSSGVIIAIKELDYSESPFSPALVMQDFRGGSDPTIINTNRDPALVVDAGFDNFVRSQWEALDSGQLIKFPFLVVGFDKPFSMRAREKLKQPCTDDQLCLEVSLDSWFLGMLTDPIELAYDRSGRQLLRFQGLSNIRGPGGEKLTVDIHYQYGEQVLLVGPPGNSAGAQYSF